ncbi:MAG: phosphoribosylglycinamide formyltransferase [Planctomycetia bacterium]|nr:phosphoribosylglycinamide formyltransferase [Planctomycetia bacterium]
MTSSREKMPIAVLISGTGRTLKNLIDKINAGELDVEIRLVVSSSKNAFGLQYAEQAGIDVAIVESSNYGNREMFSEAVFEPCRLAGVRYVVMAGYLKLLKIPADMHNRVLNIHPSLIPSFCGKNMYGRLVHEQALNRGVKVSGCTVHFVDDHYDNGPILIQETVKVKSNDTVESLSDRVLHEAEFVAYPRALQLLAENRVEIVYTEGEERPRVVIKDE